jgi:hypothetical protein
MSEIRDIKPAEPMWQKRAVDKTSHEARQESPGKEGKRKRRERRRDTDDSRGGTIDEFA